MSGRLICIHLVTSSDANDVMHARVWEVPDDSEAIERLAATLTETYGSPTEWIDDEPVQPSRAVFYEPGGG